jgi:hypothetical protein
MPISIAYSFISTVSPSKYTQTPSDLLPPQDQFAIGGGGGQLALSLGDNLQHGTTGRCTTFDNEPLCEPADFECVALELWAFTENVDL